MFIYVYVVVNFLSWLNFFFFWGGMVMCANEFETKEQQKLPEIKNELQHTAVLRKVVGKNVHATIPKGNMGYDQYTVPNDCSCRTYFCCFPLALLVPFFQFSLENRADKTTHNTFRDCRVHFF